MARRFAADTSIPIEKSRAEIGTLLYAWGALNVAWQDDHEHAQVILRFVWSSQSGQRYAARFNFKVSSLEDIRDAAIDKRTRRLSQSKLDAVRRQAGRMEHRQLLLLLKAVFNAIESGMIASEVFFLPFMETDSGQTVGEKLIAFRDGVGVRALLSAGDKS